MFGRIFQVVVATAVGAGFIYLASQERRPHRHSQDTRDTQTETRETHSQTQKDTRDSSTDTFEDSIEQQYQIYRDNLPSIIPSAYSVPSAELFKDRFVSATQGLEGAALFGHEFTFILPEGTAAFVYQNQWSEKIKNICEEQCRIDSSGQNKYCCEAKYGASVRVTYTDGWWYDVKTDSGVLEVIGKPQTSAEIAENVDRIQNQIFDFAKNQINIAPDEFEGGGHIHIGVTSGFKNSASLLRNFFVDVENHPAMFLGAISNSIPNSPLAIETEASREAFKIQLDKFDREVMTQESWNDTVKIVFFSELMAKCKRKSALPRRSMDKFHVVNVNHISRDMGGKYTLEIRGLLPQQNAQEYSLLVRLFDARIKYLQQNYRERLISYEGKTLDYSRVIRVNELGERTDKVRVDRKTKRPIVIDRRKSLDEFNDYVLKSGLDPRDFNALLKNDLQDL